MWPIDAIRSQLGSPSGPFGTLLIAPVLNVVNRGLIDRAIEILEPGARHHVLDIGFGAGYSLLALARRVTRGRVTGVDHSREMVAGATRLLQERDLEDRIQVMWGDVADMPLAERTFDRVLTVNTVYYWPDLHGGLREIARVMKPRGRVAVGFRPRHSVRMMTLGSADFQSYEADEIVEAMCNTGFERLQVERRNGWGFADTVVVSGCAKAVSPGRPQRLLSKSRPRTS